MGQLLEIADKIASDPFKGIVILLVLLLGLTMWAYHRERKRIDEIQGQRIIEAREDTKLMTTALVEASSAVRGFKESNDALRLAFETLVRTQGTS